MTTLSAAPTAGVRTSSRPATGHLLSRAAAGAAIGAVAWFVVRPLLPMAPASVRFVLAWALFTIGPGVAVTAWITRRLDTLRRTVITFAVGSAAAPVVIDALGRAHALGAFPFVATALAGVGIVLWRAWPRDSVERVPLGDLAACVVLVGVALAIGTIVFAHRLTSTADGLAVFGSYDSVDLSFYAAWASEATHTVPPTASFYAGHQLNAAYYTGLVLAMVHRFADVPLLTIYFRYAWPTFVALGALTGFVLVRALASAAPAFVAMLLVLVGGDLSYVAAWLLPHATFEWDYLLWPTNFLAPTMEVLQFNTWAPTLPVFFGTLFAMVRALQTRERGWTIAAALLLACLFEFKPFAYAIVAAALLASTVFSRGDARRQFGVMLGLGVVCTLPFLYVIAGLHDDRRSRMLLDLALLPQRMLMKLDVQAAFWNASGRIAPFPRAQRPIYLLLATALFLLVGPGVRWFGAAGVWRAIRGRWKADPDPWRLLGWSVVAGVAVPFVLVTDPYVDTLQFYQTGLYVGWIFAAVAATSFAQRRGAIGVLTLWLMLAASLPSSAHFLRMKWADQERPAVAGLSAGDARIADYLRHTDPETTIVLHDRPGAPSLMTIVSERRVALAWGPPYYAVGSQDRMRDVNRFFSSADRDAGVALEVLRRLHVTHVVVRPNDRVHRDVLARLRPIVESPAASLYEVPPDLETRVQ